MANELPPPVNHVFLDFENVSEIDPLIIGARTVQFTLFLGPRHKKLDVDIVEKLIEHAASVHLVRLTSSGKNALDFALAYYMGRAAVADPGGFFHIVSKDKGYDPLIEHLRSKHIKARRHDDFSSLKFGGPAGSSSPGPVSSPPAPARTAGPRPQPAPAVGPVERVLQGLRLHPNNRPRRKATLLRHLSTRLGNKMSETEIAIVVEELSRRGVLSIDPKGVVTYHL